jgi:co-chaperonin GroES (HSP10)
MKMKPMGDHLLLKKKENENKTKSGIIMSSNEDVYGYAEVIAVGPGIFTQTGNSNGIIKIIKYEINSRTNSRKLE